MKNKVLEIIQSNLTPVQKTEEVLDLLDINKQLNNFVAWINENSNSIISINADCIKDYLNIRIKKLTTEELVDVIAFIDSYGNAELVDVEVDDILGNVLVIKVDMSGYAASDFSDKLISFLDAHPNKQIQDLFYNILFK